MGTFVNIPNADFGKNGMLLSNAINIETTENGVYHYRKNNIDLTINVEGYSADISLNSGNTSADFGDTNDGASADAYKIKFAEVHSANNHTALSFWNCVNLEGVELEDWDSSGIAKMTKMFFKCKSLESIDFSQFKMDSCYECNYMFYGCESLTEADINDWNFGSSYANLEAMFNKCTSLVSFDMSNNPKKSIVSTMKNMFTGCTNLHDVKFGTFDAQKLSSVNRIFESCKSLGLVDFSGFTFTNLKDASYAFLDAVAEKIIFNRTTPLLTNTEQMFVRCNVEEIDLEGWVVPALSNANNMFTNCSKVKELDLSGVSFASGATINNMFQGCTNLAKVKCNGVNSAILLARLQADMGNYTWTLDVVKNEIVRSNTEKFAPR